MTIGVLAFQGDFAEHMDVLHILGARAIEVRTLSDLALVQGLIIPGGESTVMAKFLHMTGVGDEIRRRAVMKSKYRLPVYGTCAGAILLAAKVLGKNAPEPLGLIDMTIDRNAYGNQISSFETDISIQGIDEPTHVSFIRAPKIVSVGKDVDVLASYGGVPVLVRHGHLIAGTFHPEMRGEKAIHEMFLESVDVVVHS